MLKDISFLFFILILHATGFTQSTDRSIRDINLDLDHAKEDSIKANLSLELALAYVHKPGEEKKDLDSALIYIKQAESINKNQLHDKAIEAQTYFAYSNAFRERGDTAIGHQYIDKAVSIYKNLSLPTNLGNAYLEITSYYYSMSRKDMPYILQCADSALSQFKLSGNQERQAVTLKKMADWNITMANYGKALGELKETLNIYKANHTTDIQDVYDLLNLVYINLGDYPTAIENGLAAEQTALQAKDKGMGLCTIYYRLALAYNKWTNYKSPEAAEFYLKALNIALINKDYQSIQFITAGLCYAYVNLHQPGKAIALIHKLGNNVQFNYWADSFYVFSAYLPVYVEAKKFNMARYYADYLVKVLADTAKSFIDEQPDLAYRSLVTYFFNTKQYRLAEKYANINLAFCEKNTNRALVAVAHNYKAMADSAVGDFKSALEHYRSANIINDSIFNDKKAFQFAQMQVAFNTKQKEDSLKINQQNLTILSDQSKADLNRAKIIRNIIIFSALLLLVISFTGYQFKQKSNRKLQAQQKVINLRNDALHQTVQEKNKLLGEKEWLVKEIHHRVKNNLQMIISLLNAQSEFLEHPSALNAIKESRERMQAVALIHQRLYQPGQGTSLNMHAYLQEMVNYLGSSFADTERIDFKLDIGDINLDVSQAVPLGLIINEAITNSVKYAFPSHQPGRVDIILRYRDTENIVLQIKDNGKGLPKDFDFSKNDSLGLQLIHLFAEQLEGKLQFNNAHGVEISLTFKQFHPENKNGSLLKEV